MGFGTFLLDLVRPRKMRREPRDPSAEMLIDAMRKIIFGIFIMLFGYLFFFATTNFWDVVINLNDFLDAIATKLGIS
jgi:hypothetical protein